MCVYLIKETPEKERQQLVHSLGINRWRNFIKRAFFRQIMRKSPQVLFWLSVNALLKKTAEYILWGSHLSTANECLLFLMTSPASVLRLAHLHSHEFHLLVLLLVVNVMCGRERTMRADTHKAKWRKYDHKKKQRAFVILANLSLNMQGDSASHKHDIFSVGWHLLLKG